MKQRAPDEVEGVEHRFGIELIPTTEGVDEDRGIHAIQRPRDVRRVAGKECPSDCPARMRSATGTSHPFMNLDQAASSRASCGADSLIARSTGPCERQTEMMPPSDFRSSSGAGPSATSQGIATSFSVVSRSTSSSSMRSGMFLKCR